MVNIVVDTNVIISGFITTNGNPAKVTDMIRDNDERIQLCYNKKIWDEYKEVLNRSHFHFDKEKVADLLNKIKKYGVSYEPPRSTFSMIDEKDRCFYDVAVHFDAKLITGNGRHYPMEWFVVTPTEFLAGI
ncbi:MAG: putative toxin-antitoxin system toxin component, PIN family [Defluviitaleaceae bacterium]|nr:putative toxin-antitoxin system toxin component, PIN family [Defluviitaleaceae bacterium]